MREIKLKIAVGFRDDQYMVIDGEEAHKAYYLFTHPEERAIFKNGAALIGKNIQGIYPAWNEIMGWNPTHKLGDDDWNTIRNAGIDTAAQNLMLEAKEVSYMLQSRPRDINKSLSEIRMLLLDK